MSKTPQGIEAKAFIHHFYSEQAAEATRVLQKEVKEADTDHNGLIDFREFQHYFQRMALYQQNESRKQKIKRKLVPAGACQSLANYFCLQSLYCL